jgi:hypothetical protein
MKFDKKTRASVSQALVWVAIFSVGLAGVGAMGTDIWLASTQWLLVAAVSILFAIYLKLS